MHAASRWTLAAAALALGSACRPVLPSPPDAGPTLDAGPVDAGPPPPPALALIVRAMTGDGGTLELPLDAAAPSVLDPTSDFEVWANAPLKNYRVRVFDDAERVLPSDDTANDADGQTLYRLHLSQPLRPGRRYALLLDAQSGPLLLDGFGRSHGDVRVEFKTSGERERSEKKGPHHRQRR